MPLTIGDTAPNFDAETTHGRINFYDWLGDSWGVLFSHPKDFTPVCTTELGYMAKLESEFARRGVKVLALSVDPVSNHAKWSVDIADTQGMAPNYPMIGDTDLAVSKLYGMLPASLTGTSEGRTAADNQTVRCVFIVGPGQEGQARARLSDEHGPELRRNPAGARLAAADRAAQGVDAGAVDAGWRRDHRRFGDGRRRAQGVSAGLEGAAALLADRGAAGGVATERCGGYHPFVKLQQHPDSATQGGAMTDGRRGVASAGDRVIHREARLNLIRNLNVALLVSAAMPGAVRSQGTLVTDSVSSPGLASNVVGDHAVRQLLVYLPASYRRDPARRYPVLYLLHGATSTPDEWLNGTYQGLNLQLTLDSLMAAGAIPEFIVAMPNADNALGAGWYANSSATGNWEDFVVEDLVHHMDRRYRTDAIAARRALVGHSMGGFGALAMGFRHPDVFGFVYAISPCCIGFVGALASSGPAWPALAAITRWQDAPGGVRLVLGMAAALDGNRSDPRLFDELPFRSENGATVPNPAAEAHWLAGMPPDLAAAMVRRGDRAPVLHLEAGSREPGILDGIGLLRNRLDSLGIPYSEATFIGGHIDRVRDRFTRQMLPAVGKWFGQTSDSKEHRLRRPG